MSSPMQPIIIKVPGTLEDARAKASGVAMESFRETCPVRIFEQGSREMVSGVLPVRVMDRLLTRNSAKKGDTADKAMSANNRPLIKEHWEGFSKYLIQAIEKGEHFIIPPLTLNATNGMQIYVPDVQGSLLTGYAVLPYETSIFITDGQHRFLGIKEVIEKTTGTEKGDAFMNTGIPFMMTLEADNIQVHQDFADAGRTRALPPSLLAVYDTRQPANAAVMQIIEGVPLLKDRVDATSNSVGKGSPFVFLVNQVRQFVKHSLTGSASSNEANFAKQSVDSLANGESRERWVRSRVAFLNAMTEIVPDWNEIAQLPPPGGADASYVAQKTKAVKERPNVPLNGAFLTTLGLVSHKLLSDMTGRDAEESEMMEELREVLKPLESTDWSREGELWQDNIVTGGRIRTQGPAVNTASKKMLAALGIADLEASEQASQAG